MRTTARIAAFIPGASPPLVKIPMRFIRYFTSYNILSTAKRNLFAKIDIQKYYVIHFTIKEPKCLELRRKKMKKIENN
ncbi:hypothetical protein DQ178_12645 [Enterococcus faecalis]|nr:hypothetical protein [Enterococcus faecalis]